MTLGLTTADWQQLNDAYLKSKNLKSAPSTSGASESIFKEGAQDTNGNKCTDGNDDGKIGFFSAVGNIIEGAAKGLWNGIKSCFTNSEGKFSLGKTLLTVGIGALCIAFPVVGLVACGVGAVVGGVKMVKGVSNAVNAKTDAEAKAAWENVGDGGATLVGSALGAKGCFGAMKATSTASSISSVDDIAKALGQTDDVAATLKNCGVNNVDEVLGSVDDIDDVSQIVNAVQTKGKGSAFGQLDDSATFMDKTKAIGQDAWSSTKNNGQKVWTKVQEVKADVDDYRAVKKANKDYDDAMTNYEEIKYDKSVSKADKQKAIDKIKEASDALDEKSGTKGEAWYDKTQEYGANRQKLKDANADLKATQTDLKAKGIKGDEYKAAIEPKVQAVADAKAQTLTGQAKAGITNTINKSETVKYFKNLKPTEKTKFVDGLRTMKDNFSFRQVLNNLSKDGQNIWKFLIDDGNTYAKAVQEFGYDKVAEVLGTIYGYQMSSNAI